MIFATVGTQLRFPRLIVALDVLAQQHDIAVIAQTCGHVAGTRAIRQQPFFAPDRMEELAREAETIVGHAGIGTIMLAARARRPLILYPRRAALGEHRNEHQLATARAMRARPGIHVAESDAELRQLIATRDLEPMAGAEAIDRHRLVAAIAGFVNQTDAAAAG